jgi:hypothetical protein
MTANAEAWGIPAAVITDFTALTGAADTALAAAKNETTRTPVATARCREAFEALTDKMRDIKRRYFLEPPLTEADLAALGLDRRDPHPTPSGVPTATQLLYGNYWPEFCRRQNSQAIRHSRIARHELGVKIVYVTGSPADPANKGFRIWYSVIAPGETPPADPEDLRKSFYTTRKKDLIEFDFGDSGKTAYFAVQIENGGKKGPWGPVVSALIP